MQTGRENALTLNKKCEMSNGQQKHKDDVPERLGIDDGKKFVSNKGTENIFSVLLR